MFKYIFVMIAFRNVNRICIYVKHDSASAFLRETWLLAFFVNVRQFSEFFMVREKAYYVCVKLFTEEV